jgi:predicted flap endonuclease-1-like 5' DNA nuclease
MATLKEIEGIGSAYAAKLNKAGVRGVNGLLKTGGTRKGRVELAKATGFNAKTILEWVNRADLFRVKGIGSQYSDLLEAAGVDTVVELGKRKPETLLATFEKANSGKKRIVRQLPSLSQVKDWVKKAKSLKRAVEY